MMKTSWFGINYIKLGFSSFKYGNARDSVLHNYFNNQIAMSNVDLVKTMMALKNSQPTHSFFKDHRWLHLTLKIEKNVQQFGIEEKIKLLNVLSKLGCYQQLYYKLIDGLTKKMQMLDVNEQANLLYYIAKGNKVNTQTIKVICDGLLDKLGENESKLNIRQKSTENNKKSTQGIQQNLVQEQPVDCKSLVLILWSLNKMKISDSLINSSIVKNYLRGNLHLIPTSLFPLFLSTLWMKKMHNKRIFKEATVQLRLRSEQLEKLDFDKLKLVLCTLCKPDDKDTNTIIWLLETIALRSSSESFNIDCASSYQIISSCFRAQALDLNLYKSYIRIICQDLSKLRPKQYVELMHIMASIGVRQFNEELHIVSEHFWNKSNHFLKNVHELHPARAKLRQLVLIDDLKAPSYLRKMMIREEQDISRRRRQPQKQTPTN